MDSSTLEPIKNGRPFKFTDPAELRRLIQTYFDLCDPHIEERVVEGGVNQKGHTIWYKREVMTDQRPYTMSGLALYLGVSRQTLKNYQDPRHYTSEVDIPEDVRQEIMDTVGEAKARCESFTEGQLYTPYSNGAKFSLTNNFDGWVDKSVQEHQGGFFDTSGRLAVEIVNPEPAPDEPAQPNAEAKPDPEPGPSAAA